MLIGQLKTTECHSNVLRRIKTSWQSTQWLLEYFTDKYLCQPLGSAGGIHPPGTMNISRMVNNPVAARIFQPRTKVLTSVPTFISNLNKWINLSDTCTNNGSNTNAAWTSRVQSHIQVLPATLCSVEPSLIPIHLFNHKVLLSWYLVFCREVWLAS